MQSTTTECVQEESMAGLAKLCITDKSSMKGSVQSTTTECTQEESTAKGFSKLCSTDKSYMLTVGAEAELKTENTPGKENAANKGRLETKEENVKIPTINKRSVKKNKNYCLTKTSSLSNISKTDETKLPQGGGDSMARDEETEAKRLINDFEEEETVVQTPGVIPKTSKSDLKYLRENLNHRPECAADADPQIERQKIDTDVCRPKDSRSNTDRNFNGMATSTPKPKTERQNIDTQVSTVSMDGGEQDGDRMQQQPFQEDNHQNLLMHELREPGQSSHQQSRDSVQTFSRFDTIRSESVIMQGGHGGVNVFDGTVNVESLSVNLPTSGLDRDEGSMPSGGTNRAIAGMPGAINVFPGGNLNVGAAQGVTVPAFEDCFEADGVIFNAEADTEMAKEFKRHLEEDIPCDNVRAELFQYIDPNMSMYRSLETVFSRFRYAFVLITKHFKDDKIATNLGEMLHADSLEGNCKQDRIIAVWTSKDKANCPIQFKHLKGVSYYMRENAYSKNIYVDCLKKNIEDVRQKSQDWARQIREDRN